MASERILPRMSFSILLCSFLLCTALFSCGDQHKEKAQHHKKEKSVEVVQLSETPELDTAKNDKETKKIRKVIPPEILPDPEPYPEPYPPIFPYYPDPILPDPDPVEIQPQVPYDLFQVDVQPEYPGGIQALMKFIDDHLVYPLDALENQITGRVYVKFTILKNGETTDFKILRGLYPSLDREVLKVLKAMEIWKPALLKDEPVDVYFTMPVKLSLD